MRVIITLFLCFPFLFSAAQNWEYFPKDSLRCYTVDDYGSLMGIDFRDHSRYGVNEIIHLDSFGNFIPIDTVIERVRTWQYYFRNKNSHYGNRIEKSDSQTLIVITDDFDKSISDKVITLKHGNHLGHQWTFFEDDSIEIKARVAEIGVEKINGQLDSTKSIHLWGFNKNNLNDSLLHVMRVGKTFGVYTTPRLYGFVNHDFRTYYTYIDHWMSYNPDMFMFYNSLTEGDAHYRYSSSDKPIEFLRIRTSLENRRYTSEYEGYSVEYLGFDGNNFNSDTTYLTGLSDFDWFDDLYGLSSLPWYFVPGRVYNLDRGIVVDHRISIRCDNTYQLSISGREGGPYSFWRVEGENLFRYNKDLFYVEYREGEFWNHNHFSVFYAQNIGQISLYGYFARKIFASHSIVLLYHPNDQCGKQNPIVFANVKQPRLNKFHFNPNPASTSITLSLKSNIPVRFEIIDIQGKLISEGLTTGKIDVLHIPSGIYYLRLYGENESYSSKLVIAR